MAEASRRLFTSEGLGSIFGSGGGGGDFSSLLVQTDPMPHSVSYKMNTGCTTGVNTADSRVSHPTSFYCRGYEYVDQAWIQFGFEGWYISSGDLGAVGKIETEI